MGENVGEKNNPDTEDKQKKGETRGDNLRVFGFGESDLEPCWFSLTTPSASALLGL